MNYIYKKIIEHKKRFGLKAIEYDIKFIKDYNAHLLNFDLEEAESELKELVKKIEIFEKEHKNSIKEKGKVLKIKSNIEMRKNVEEQIKKGEKIKEELQFQLSIIKKWK